MSYHLPAQRRAVPAPVQMYPIVPLSPLGQAPLPAPTQPTILGIPRDLLILIVVVLVIVAVMWWINERGQKALKPNRSRAKKQSTAEMAKNLYRRLEDRGGINETTMKSLQQLGRKR